MHLPLTDLVKLYKSALKFDESALKFNESALKSALINLKFEGN